MATGQTTSNQSKKASPQRSRGSSSKGSRAKPSQATSERDDTYGLISVIYHALQGAETCHQYIEDARRGGNDELVTFFEECRDEQNRRALEGRRLLSAELQDIDEETEAMLDDDDS
jgi:hypothetical protein